MDKQELGIEERISDGFGLEDINNAFFTINLKIIGKLLSKKEKKTKWKV